MAVIKPKSKRGGSRCNCDCVYRPTKIETAPLAVQAIRSRRNQVIRNHVQNHLAPDWEQRYRLDYGKKAWIHLIPSWQLLPYCEA